MLVVRRNAPDGSYFHDGIRAAGVFGSWLGFAICWGFVVFLAFTSYDTARSGAEAEALIVAQRSTAQFFPSRQPYDRRAGLLRESVAGVQWNGWRPARSAQPNPA
jgi:hypothetical protein